MKKNSNIRALIKISSKNIFFRIGNIIIDNNAGDIYYIPSSKYVADSNNKYVGLEHFVWHQSGRVHLKSSSKKKIIEYGTAENDSPVSASNLRMKIHDIGYQEMWRDIVVDILNLPILDKNVKNSDIVFVIGNYTGPIIFILSIVSGRLIVKKHNGQNVPIKNISQERKKLLLAMENRGLGSRSDNADKKLQFQLYKFPGNVDDLLTGRRIIIPKNSKVDRGG